MCVCLRVLARACVGLWACVGLCACVVCVHALSGLSLSAIGSDTEGDGEDMFSDVESKPSTNPEPR